MFDTLIRHAEVYDGRHRPPQRLDVAISGDRIAAMEAHIPAQQARQVVDAEGLALTPGLIDPHASTGFGYFFPHAADHKLYQGITTEIFGNCGTSPGPVGERLLPTMNRLAGEIGFPFHWRSLGQYFEAIAPRLAFNVGSLVGHSTLRAGFVADWKQVQPQELAQMKAALAQAMEEGALGLSTGLIYAPGCFAPTEEVVELARIARQKGGVYASHIRDERDGVEQAVEEALRIGRQANIPVLISHLKAAERKNWGKIPRLLEKIEQHNAQNEAQACIDVYPYTAVSTKLRAFIPKQLLQDGIEALPAKLRRPEVRRQIAEWIDQRGYDLSRMLIISSEYAQYYGKTVQQIAAENGLSEADAMAEILSTSTEMWIVYHCINEQDMDTAICWPRAMVCTDSWSYPINAPNSIGQPHPRSYGAFTQYLQDYVFKKRLLSFEEAIHKASYLPAQFFGLEKRGLIQPGYYADLVLFDLKHIRANATYLQPKRLSEGVEYLWVNGRAAISRQQIQETNTGKILTKNAVNY